jgi:hypothetical protein
MTPQLIQLFRDALDLDPAERSAYLNAQCSDPALRVQLDALLLAAEQTEPPMPVIALPTHARGTIEATDRSGEQIGSFRLLRPLGSGGMGAVWLAERVSGFSQQVAIKWLHAGLSQSARSRFARERETLAKLEHPGIARIVDGGSDGAADWFAMEFVDGVPLDSYVKSTQANLNQRINLMITLCDAVQYAHQNLIVHRDLKPGNILVNASGQPKLLDFGVAKLLDDVNATESRAPMTYAYAAPEQIRGDAITTATDVYALGVILFELLTGQRPHKPKGDGSLSLLQVITDTDATAPSSVINKSGGSQSGLKSIQLKGDLDTIVLKALSRDPQRRYASALALSDDLAKFLRGLPIAARPDSIRYRANKWLRRQPVLAAVLFVSVLSLLAMTAYSWHQAGRATLAAQAANAARMTAESARALALQARAQVQAELDVQAALREHLTAVLIRATASGKPISPELLFALSADTRLAAGISERVPTMAPATERALRLTLSNIAMLRQDDAQLQEMVRQLQPLMIGASVADQTQFAMLQATLKTYASTHRPTAPMAIDMANTVPGMSSSTMLVVRARLAFKLNQVDAAMALIAQAAKTTQANEIDQPMIQAAIYANYAQMLFDDAQFEAMLPQVQRALALFKKAGISGTPVPLLRALPANAALMSGQMQRALAQFDVQDTSAASPAERGTQWSGRAIAKFWLGAEREAQTLAKQASAEICQALTQGAEACMRSRWLSLEISSAAGDRRAAAAVIAELQASGADSTQLAAYQSLLAPRGSDEQVERMLLRWAQSPSRGRERFVQMRRALSVALFCQRTGQQKLAEQARMAALALSQGLQIPADSLFHRHLRAQ